LSHGNVQRFFQFLVDSGAPEQKTIIFCARDSHADDVAATMNNLYVDWCQKQNRQPLASFAFKCTAAEGKDNLPELRGASRSHFIAPTVELLTTGVDVPCLQNIVFFKYVRSPISFYQMIGRGTRLDPPTGKLMFRIYDYTNATDLFGRTFITKKPRESGGGGGTEPPLQIIVEGFDVRVSPAGHFILTNVDGRAVPVTIEEYKERLAKRLVEEIKTITEFRACWISPKWRREILGRLPDAGRSPILIQRLDEMEDFDLFDVLGELGYGLLPKTRIQRTEAFYYKHRPWLSSLRLQACNTLSALVKVFSHSGTDGLESSAIFHTPEIAKAGGLKALRILGKPSEILKETKLRIFAA